MLTGRGAIIYKGVLKLRPSEITSGTYSSLLIVLNLTLC